MKEAARSEIESRLMPRVESFASDLARRMEKFLSRDAKKFYDMINYSIQLGGKRLRPFTTFNCASIFGAPDEAVYLGAMSMEFLHTFSLIHDDIMDEDEERRGKAALHTVYGTAMGILAGDFLFAESFGALSRAEQLAGVRGITPALADASTRIDLGQFMDLSFERQQDVSEDEYFEMIHLKTASLNECSALVGGLLGGLQGGGRASANGHELEALKSFGKNLGLAFQLRDDYLGVFGDPKKTGKPVGSDLKRGKKTLLTIKALNKGTRDSRRILNRVLGNAEASPGQIEDACQVLRDLEVDKECQELAEGMAAAAIKSLKVFDDSEPKKLLEMLARFAVVRDR
jgi:geranylgeranyl diphosphate synthase type I